METVGDIASIPNALPPLEIPNFAAMPELLAGGLAVALVGLAQAAGISAAVPNPDGTRPNTNGDFVAQGAANLAGGFFGALPTGGSLSRTGVAVSAGAQTRWAGIFAGIWMAALVLVAGSLAELIPMPVIGGLILVIGVELVAGRWADIKLVLRTAPLSAVAMLVTFAATTQLPLHTAILIGAITSLVLYCVKAAQVGSADRAASASTAAGSGRRCPSRPRAMRSPCCTTPGSGCSPRCRRIDEEWPKVADSRNAVVVLSMAALPDVPSSKVINALTKWATDLQRNGGRLIIAGVSPKAEAVLQRGGIGDLIGEDGIVPATTRVFGARRGRRRARASSGSPTARWLALDAAEADVAHAGVDHLRAAGRGPVAQAVDCRRTGTSRP